MAAAVGALRQGRAGAGRERRGRGPGPAAPLSAEVMTRSETPGTRWRISLTCRLVSVRVIASSSRVGWPRPCCRSAVTDEPQGLRQAERAGIGLALHVVGRALRIGRGVGGQRSVPARRPARRVIDLGVGEREGRQSRSRIGDGAGRDLSRPRTVRRAWRCCWCRRLRSRAHRPPHGSPRPPASTVALPICNARRRARRRRSWSCIEAPLPLPSLTCREALGLESWPCCSHRLR